MQGQGLEEVTYLRIPKNNQCLCGTSPKINASKAKFSHEPQRGSEIVGILSMPPNDVELDTRNSSKPAALSCPCDTFF